MTETTQTLPATFGPFHLFDLIGRGGMAEVFLAKTFTGLGTDRLTVIKRILPQFSSDATFCEMLIEEAKLCARLSHANVVQTSDLGCIDGRYYIAMEYVEGFDLNALLALCTRARIALPLQFALYMIVETLKGLDYAHRLTEQSGAPLGIIHRDVSPTNVLISCDGGVKLCDFGIAKAALGDIGASRLDEYHLKGKVAYMSPEHLAGEPVDRRADLYAAGILLWELLAGRRLFKSKDEEETLRKAKAAEIPELPNRGYPEFELLAAVVTRALQKDPERRFKDGKEFIRALEDYMHAAGLLVSQLRFADFLMEHFGEDLLRQRRARERSLAEMMDQEHGAPASARDAAADKECDAIRAAFDAPDDEEPACDEAPPEPAVAPPEPVAAAKAPSPRGKALLWLAVAVALAGAGAVAAYLLATT
ncbi:MAG: serine/threonine-protein kinase [Deltaproteobacteria bacterium]|nr:serine/threonine-protein kinase [Deltaproteobacteria bacterium]